MNTRNLDFIMGQNNGTAAFNKGKPCVPACDPNFIATLVGRHMGSPSTSNYLDGWHRGWAQANVDAPLPVLKVGP